MNEKLNIAPFVKGDRVVCINDSGTSGLLKGRTYTVFDVNTCRCGIQEISLGFETEHVGTICASCGNRSIGLYMYRSDRFRKVQESKFRAVSFEKVMEETEIICEN